MMPLTFAPIGEEQMIHKVGGNSEVRTHLENLGFVSGWICDCDFHHRRKSDRERERNPA